MMKLDAYISSKHINSSKLCSIVLPLFSAVLTTVGIVLVFSVVPNERVMGAVQRVFYFHVGSALAAYLAIGISLFASAFYLATRKDSWDCLNEASAHVAFLLCSIVLISGMIWGKSAWNTWWRWEPRLVSFLILWLILFAQVMLRSLASGNSQIKSYAAVLGILAAVNVPIVIVSVQFLAQSEQLHPEVVGKQGLKTASYVYTLITCSLAMFCTTIWFTIVKTQAILLERRAMRILRMIDS